MSENNELMTLDVSAVPAVFKTNFPELEAALQKKLSDYQNMVVTDEKSARDALSELVSLRKSLETARKKVKSEAEAPIKEFDAGCKHLLKMITDTEAPIKEGIAVYDEKVKEEKRAFAMECIIAAADKYSLNERFKEELTLLPEYGNKTATKKAVRESIESRALDLSRRQEAFYADLAKISERAAFENETLSVKLDPASYSSLYERGVMECDEIIERIRKDAGNIRLQEEKAKEEAERRQREKEEEEARRQQVPEVFVIPAGKVLDEPAEGIPADGPEKELSVEEPVIPRLPEAADDEDVPEELPVFEKPKEKMFEVEIRLTGGFSDLRELCAFCRKRGIVYDVLSQKKI